jgi:hypothetical protein
MTGKLDVALTNLRDAISKAASSTSDTAVRDELQSLVGEKLSFQQMRRREALR